MIQYSDYVEMGARVMVEVFDDRVEISDPGGLPMSLKPEEFGTRSVLRNRVIADLLLRAGYIERMGTGIRRIEDLCRENGTKPPDYDFKGFFTTTYVRESYSVTGAQSPTQSDDPVIRLLMALSGGELREKMGLKHRQTFRGNYLHPALNRDYIELTIPEKPNSRLQKYRLTEKGRKIVRGE